jgi:hypothetical protein
VRIELKQYEQRITAIVKAAMGALIDLIQVSIGIVIKLNVKPRYGWSVWIGVKWAD